jgi:hypothetical protein
MHSQMEDIPGAPECCFDGYADGQDRPFNHDRNEECINNTKRLR